MHSPETIEAIVQPDFDRFGCPYCPDKGVPDKRWESSLAPGYASFKCLSCGTWFAVVPEGVSRSQVLIPFGDFLMRNCFPRVVRPKDLSRGG